MVEFHPAFADDLVAGIRYHNGAVPGLGGDFLKEVFKTIARIKAHPLAFSQVHADVRRARLKRFKWYAVRFSLSDDSSTIRILSVLHGARHPDSGTERR